MKAFISRFVLLVSVLWIAFGCLAAYSMWEKTGIVDELVLFIGTFVVLKFGLWLIYGEWSVRGVLDRMKCRWNG